MSDLIRDDLLERLRELAEMEHRSVDDVLTDMLEQYIPASDDDDYPDEEAAYEAERLTRILGDALNPDGSIDVAKLDARTKPITLEELFPDGDLYTLCSISVVFVPPTEVGGYPCEVH